MLQSDEILQLKYDDELQSVIMVWNGFPGREEFRIANEEVLDLIKTTGAKKIIGDLRNMKIINVRNQQWLFEDWLPRAIENGLEYAALVKSEDFFNRQAVDNVVQQMKDDITIRYFDAFLSARVWIRSVG